MPKLVRSSHHLGSPLCSALLSVAVVSGVALTLQAQEVPRVEVFTGYSYLRASDSFSVGINQSGWDVSGAFNFARSFGVVADFSNHYGFRPRVFAPIGSGGKGFTFLFGPQYSYRRVPRLTPFAHALFGAIQSNRVVGLSIGLSGATAGLVGAPECAGAVFCYQPVTSFAAALGGGLDVKATQHVWLRTLQLEYFRGNLKVANGASTPQNDVRFSSGIVFRFGKR